MYSFISKFTRLAITYNSYDQMIKNEATMKQKISQWYLFHPVPNVLKMNWTSFILTKLCYLFLYKYGVISSLNLIWQTN
jgi:hypothetical protein